MRTVVVITSLRVLTWCCAVLLAVLSLLPAHDMVRTSLPGRVEHFIAYAGSAAIAMVGYGATRGAAQIIGGFLGVRWRSGVPPALLSRSAFSDRGLRSIGVWGCGGLVIALVRRRCSG